MAKRSMMTADQKRLKTMAVGMAIIITCSAAMHVFLIKKKAIRTHRYEPQFGQTEPTDKQAGLAPSTLQGEVIAVSFNKFFLRANDKVQPIIIGTLRMPEVGQQITVSHSGGSNPTAVTIKDDSPLEP